MYELPRELIAPRPAEPRDSARLLLLERSSGLISHRVFRELPEFLSPGDCLVLNDTRVLAARLYGRKAVTGGGVEILLLSPYAGPLPAGEQPGPKVRYFRCLGQPAKNLKPGTCLIFQPSNGQGSGSVQAQVVAWEEGERIVRFEGREVEQALYSFGEVPLPPYIDRPVQPEDADWYQTVYAREAGAVAAPTAGLHFTEELLEAIRRKGIRVAFLTLHVGWGTFKPVGERELREGRLHEEWFRIPSETMGAIAETKASGGRVVAVGTTVVRALETEAKTQRGLTPKSSLGSAPIWFSTDLFIRPGFEFRVVDALITNFHLPGTSLLLLVAAFAGEEKILAAYREAIREKYRFYSYGDAMLIL